jgi:aminoglycoside N3'-acetyltransferase
MNQKKGNFVKLNEIFSLNKRMSECKLRKFNAWLMNLKKLIEISWRLAGA